MPNTVIAIRQSGETGNTPSLGVLANGELAINYADGILYYKSSSNTLGSILTSTPGGLDTEVQFNDGGSFGGDSGFTYNKTTNTLTIDNIISNGLNVAPAIQASFDAANTAQADATGAFALANTTNTTAEAAYAFANTVNVKVDAAFSKANSANVLAQGAYDQANTALNDSLAFAIALG